MEDRYTWFERYEDARNGKMVCKNKFKCLETYLPSVILRYLVDKYADFGYGFGWERVGTEIVLFVEQDQKRIGLIMLNSALADAGQAYYYDGSVLKPLPHEASDVLDLMIELYNDRS